ncbi:MAG: S41 family peptidase [Roseateles sp.]|uniref:S41 family peptidase n=1 Tax=Roseateles sp. TaxID=1971397 RepID=UPI0039E7CE6A
MPKPRRRPAPWPLLAWLTLGLLAGCGGGGGGGGSSGVPGDAGGSSGLSPDPAGPSASFAQECAASNTLAAASLRTATLDREKQWLRAYFDEAYLWRDEVPRVAPDAPAYGGSDTYAAMDAYFEALKSPQLTDSGARRDRFSFTYPTADWQAMSDGGIEAGYGIEWSLASNTPPRRIRVAYVEAGSAAATSGVARGDELLSTDGVAADVADRPGVDTLNAALYPAAGTSHLFSMRRTDGSTYTLSLTGASVTRNPVPLARAMTLPGGAKAGYLLFNDHNLPSERLLIDAVADFRAQGVTALVLDLRYNGGGYLYIASELATMIAGRTRTAGQAFETLRYNDRRSSQNERTPFYAEACLAAGGRCTSTQPLPTLDLARVYVLAQRGTCSASESVINGLRGVDVEVVLVGGKTCGKPYGFTAKDNCGISYFPIEFAGVNAKGFGDYTDGFVPGSGASPRFLPGCAVDDDFTRALGDPQERMLATALAHATTGQCPAGTAPLAAAATARAQAAPPGEGAAALYPRRHPARGNRLLLPQPR